METNTNGAKSIKANAILCPTCCVEYLEVQFDLEVDRAILYNVKALRCPKCREEKFTPKQAEEIMKRISV